MVSRASAVSQPPERSGNLRGPRERRCQGPGDESPRKIMFRFDAEKSVHFCDGLRRRDFLHAGSLALPGPDAAQTSRSSRPPARCRPARDVNCIMLFLVGGPSQLDTWDMKPDAPAEIRGPFRPIPTNVAGHPDQRDLSAHGEARGQVRAAPLGVPHGAGVHDTGHQMMQTGPLLPVRRRAAALRLRR